MRDYYKINLNFNINKETSQDEIINHIESIEGHLNLFSICKRHLGYYAIELEIITIGNRPVLAVRTAMNYLDMTELNIMDLDIRCQTISKDDYMYSGLLENVFVR